MIFNKTKNYYGERGEWRDESIFYSSQSNGSGMVERRRNLHRYPETGWTEFRTASLIITELRKLGYEVHFGAEVMDSSRMAGLPAADVLAACQKRAVEEGADPGLVEK